MLAINKKEQARKQFTFFACGLIALWLGLTPVFASGVPDLLLSIVAFLISEISKLVLGIIETVASVFLTVMAVDISTIKDMGFLNGFIEFTGGIQLVAFALASIAVLWQLFTVLMGPFIGEKQVQSVSGILTRALIFIPLTYFIQPLALGALQMFQSIYTGFFEVYNTDINGVFNFTNLSTSVNPDTFLTDMGIGPSNIIAAGLMDVVSILLSCALMIVITWNFVKLLLEMTQRFVAMLVYVFLSPLAAACGVGANSINISKQSLTLFASSGILWILNVWSVGITLSLFGRVTDAVASGATGFFLWAVITYGFLKIVQQLDDIFKAVGATNVGFSGSLLDDILSVSHMSKAAFGGGDKKGGLNSFAEKGLLGVKGSDANNPAKPEASKIASSSGSSIKPMQATSKATAPTQTRKDGPSAPTLKSTPQGNLPSSLGQVATSLAGRTAAWAGGTAIGKAVRGTIKTGENIGTRVSNGVATLSAARDNGAMSTVHRALNKTAPEDRATAMKNIAQNNPGALNNEATKGFIGDNLGLKENQSVSRLAVDKDGQLSATISTQNADGSVGLSQVDNINDMSFGSSGGMSSKASSEEMPGYVADAHETASTNPNARAAAATVEYTGMDGNSHSAGISDGVRSTADGGSMTDFDVTPSEGSNPINVRAPASMSAEDVGSIISGTASEATIQKFNSGGGDASAVMSALNVDQSVPGSVSSNEKVNSTMNESNLNQSVTNLVSSDSVTSDYTDSDTKKLKNILEKAKKAEDGTLSSEDAPVGKHL